MNINMRQEAAWMENKEIYPKKMAHNLGKITRFFDIALKPVIRMQNISTLERWHSNSFKEMLCQLESK